MNSPVTSPKDRLKLRDRLRGRRPLYTAIRENIQENNSLHVELMEPRLLLSADLMAVADALQAGVDQAGDAIDDFFDAALLNEDLPVLVFPGDAGSADAVNINDLLSIDVDLNSDGSISGDAETLLASFDSDAVDAADDRVSLKEFFHGAFIDPLQSTLADIRDGTETLDSAGFTDYLATLSDDFSGELATATAGLIDFDVIAQPFLDTGDSLEFSLNFDLSFDKSLPFDLGTELEDLGLTIEDETIRAVVGAELSFGFTFGVDGIVPEDNSDPDNIVPANYDAALFYTRIGDLTAEATGALTANDVSARFGFLGLEADLALNLVAGVLADRDETQKLRSEDLDDGFNALFPSVGETVGTGISGSAALSVSTTGPDIGVGALGSVTLGFSGNPFALVPDGDRFAPDISVESGNLDAFANFNALSASSYVGLIEQLAQSFGVVGNSDDISGYELPFVNTSFGELANFSDVLVDALVYDNNDTPDDTSDDIAKLLDLDENGQLVPAFDTAQQLGARLAELGGQLAGADLAYENEALTLNLNVSETFVGLNVPLAFDLDLDPIAGIAITQGALAATAEGRLQFTVGVDLSGGTAKSITGATRLDGAVSADPEQTSLNDAVEAAAQLAITGSPLPAPTFSSNNATFEIELSDIEVPSSKNATYLVSVPVLSGGELLSTSDIVASLTSQLNDTLAISLYVGAEQTASGRFDLVSRSDSTFQIVSGNDVARNILALDRSIENGLVYSSQPDRLDGGASGVLQSQVAIRPDFTLSSDTTITINGIGITVESDLTSDNTNIRALASDLQQAIDESETSLAGKIEVSSVRSELVIKVRNDESGVPMLTSLTVSPLPALGFDAQQTETYTPPADASDSGTVSTPDFVIQTSDGEEYEISLAGVETIQALIDKLPGDTENKVTLSINEAGTALELVDSTFGAGVQAFTVLAVNGSTAVYQLGIAGVDDANPDDYDGKIEGSTTVAGKTLADRLFVEDASLSASIEIEDSQAIKASANFGFVEVLLENGDVDVGADLEVALVNPDNNASTRITLAEFKDNFSDLSSLVSTPTITGSVGAAGDDFAAVSFDLTLATDVPGLGDAASLLGANSVGIDVAVLGSNGLVLGELPEFTIDTSALSGLPISSLSDIGISEILDGLIAVSGFLQQFEAFEFLSDPIPLIELSVNDLLSFADQLDSAVNSALDDPAGSLQGLQSALLSAFGLEPAENSEDSPVQFSLVGADGEAGTEVLRVDLELSTVISETLPLDFDLSEFTDVLEEANLAGSANLTADGQLTLNLAFGVNLGTGNSAELGDVLVFEETGISGALDVAGEDLTFRAAVGPMGLFIQGGMATVELDANAGVDADLLVFDASERDFIDFSTLTSNVSASVTGDLAANLPVFFPTDSFEAGEIEFYAGSDALGDALNLLELTTDDFTFGGIDNILNQFDPTELSLLDNIALVVDGVDLFLAALQDVLDGEVGGIALPLIGDSLSDGARFIEDFRNGFVDDFREAVATLDSGEGEIVTDMLQGLLDDLGLGTATVMLSDKTNIFGDDAAPVAESVIQWDLELGDAYVISEGVDLDLGLPGLGLETEGDVSLGITWGLNLALGLDFVNGAYLDFGTEGDDTGDLRFTVTAGLPTNITGRLGFLQLSAEERTGNGIESGLSASINVDVVDGTGEEVDVIGFSQLGSISFAPTISADADVDLDLTLGLNGDLVSGSGAFPEITAAFVLDWGIDTDFAGIGDAIGDGLIKVGFEDVGLDLGSFLNEFLAPTLEQVQEVTGPLQDIIDFITAPLPVISDLGPELSLVDIAEVFGDVDLGFIDSVADVVALINAIETSSEASIVNFGDFTLIDANDPDIGTGASLSDPRADLSGIDPADTSRRNDAKPPEDLNNKLASGSKGSSKLGKLKDAGSFAIPLFDDPSQVFGLLMGTTEPVLLTFDMKPLVVDFEYSQYFPIFGPLGASITGSLGLTADFAFGFDTTGISQFADSGFRNPEYIFNGFYVSDREEPTGEGADVAELILELGLSAGAELNLGIAKGGVAGGVFADIFFNLYDPDDDGRVRVEELLGSIENQIRFADGAAKALAPLAIFDVTGEIFAKLFAYLTLGVGPFSVTKNFDITPEITILDFEIPFERPPKLASELPDGVVQINVGELSEFRLEGNLSDGEDDIVVSGSGSNLTVSVNGISQPYSLDESVQKIVILGGEGNDTINVSGVSGNVVFDIDGGGGDDTIILGAPTPGSPALASFAAFAVTTDGTPASLIQGGPGNDILIGGDGRDIIIGGAGFDFIDGGGGDDKLFGDEVEQSDNLIRVRVDGSDVKDIIQGGSGKDIIAGGGGDDMIEGGGDDDLILGDGGLLQVLDEGGNLVESGLGLPTAVWTPASISVSETERGTSGGRDTIDGDGGNDIVYAGRGDDLVWGGDDADTLFGEAGADEIRGENGGDWISGGSEADVLFGGLGTDEIYGDDGDDLLQGDEERDLLFGGFGVDRLFGNDGDDHLRGGGDPDKLYGGDGADYLDGDFGNDMLFGDTDGQIVLAEGLAPDYELFDGALGNDELVSSYGEDILDGQFGSDDYVVNFIGGTTDRLVTTFDSGSANSGPDSLTINGSVTVSYDDSGLVRSEVFLEGTPESGDDGPFERLPGDDQFLLRANPNRTEGLAFVALLNKDPEQVDPEYPIERVDYTVSMEEIVINSGDGRDYFALDDNRATTQINGGAGNDVFQIGQIFNLPRTTDPAEGNIQSHPNPNEGYNQGETDVFATIETTRGFLSNGITEATTINGGDGNDAFVVFHNKAVLTLNGDDGSDEFTVRAFALSGSQETQQERTDISGGTDADLIQYAVNAPVGIDGGDGEDTVRVIGTEFGDDFIVAKEGVFGVGVNVNYTNVEILTVDGGAGDDRFFIQGTNADTVTTVVGGLGSDSFNVAGDPPPIISNDLLGHSGKISHTIVTDGTVYEDVRVRDVVANVADANEPGIVITPADELPRVVQGEGLASIASYTVVLTQAPKPDERVIVTAVAPRVSNDDNSTAPLIQFVGDDNSLTNAFQVEFDSSNWNDPQAVRFVGGDGVDLAADESRLGTLTHSVKTERISASESEPFLFSGGLVDSSNLPPIIELDNLSDPLPIDGSLIGATIKILDGVGEGQTRGIGGLSGDTVELTTSWNIEIGDGEGGSFEITLANGETITGDVVSAENRTTLTSATPLPDTGENEGGDLRGATVEIISGTGIGQERLIMESDGNTLTLNKPWNTALGENTVFQVQSYSAVKAPGLEVRLDESNDLPLPVAVDNTPNPGVKITESLGSTNVIEPTDGFPIPPGTEGSPVQPSVDSYLVELTQQPDEDVKVYVQPEETITTRGQVFYKQEQVSVGGDDLLEDSGGRYLLFTPENWMTPQSVEVQAVQDGVVDGGDTKVFPSIPRVLNEIQGELILEGQGSSDLAIGSLGDPLMLPLENNTPPAFGNVIEAPDSSSVLVSKAEVDAAVAELGLASVDVLISQQYTFEITEGTGRGQALIIESYAEDGDNYRFEFDNIAEWDELPMADSRFTLSTTNPNLLVDESEQVDIVTVFNNESVSNDIGTLTEDNLSVQLGGTDITADITYLGMENMTVNMGLGDDELTVESTHTRQLDLEDPDSAPYQTVTFINAGPGGDLIDINGFDGFLAVKGETGNDTIDASDASSTEYGLIAFGDEGGDTIKGGAGPDILFGDLGRIDYFEDPLDDNSLLVTRVGLEHDFETMVSEPEPGNNVQVPSNQTDGVVREAKFILARDPSVGGEDTIFGNGGDDIIIGGTANDTVNAGSHNDLVAGDNVRITRLDHGGNLSDLYAALDPAETRLYDENGSPNVVDLEPDGTGTYDNLNLILINHRQDISEDLYGADDLSGGGGHDLIFGQMGNDTIFGEMDGSPQNSGNDYIEGNAGNDTIYGNNGQDTLIGGSSDLFGLGDVAVAAGLVDRDDGSDLIFGGSGDQDNRDNAEGDNHFADSDLILGDNARVAVLPDQSFNFEDQIIVRAYTLLDYTPGGAGSDIGAADELHGELGDDTIHGMTGNDVLFGEAQDDNLIGGVGYDRIYGGTGVDGILGDDGIIQTSRNGTDEPLNGLDSGVDAQEIATRGPFVGAVINPSDIIHKSAELQAWNKGGNDVIYGGLGDDYIHGGFGDDAISGAEAEEAHYHTQIQDQALITVTVEGEVYYSYDPANPLGYDDETGKLAEYDVEDPRSEVSGFLLNFNATDGGGTKIDDGVDRIFGDLGNDWIVGGTNTDRLFGGLGDDLVNADDNLDANPFAPDVAEFADGDFVYGGGGLDVMIANTAQDRLFDWNGEYNSYYVPFSLFGAPVVNRKISPDTIDFLNDLAAGSGADLTLGGSGAFFDEIGLISTEDELAGDQRGSPRDPQPGNLKGKADDRGGPEQLLLAPSAGTAADIDAIVIDDVRVVGQAAVERWLNSGQLSEQQIELLSGLTLQIADLGGLKLAQASSDGKTIYIDVNAAGHGWFIDTTAHVDEEFQAGVGTHAAVADRMDLLSVVMHEIGHQLGFSHGENGLMHHVLETGIRTAALLEADTVYAFHDDHGLEPDVEEPWLEVAVHGAAQEQAATEVDWGDAFQVD